MFLKGHKVAVVYGETAGNGYIGRRIEIFTVAR